MIQTPRLDQGDWNNFTWTEPILLGGVESGVHSIKFSTRTIELIKRELAKRHADDADAYYDVKDPVYDLIWDAALD